MDSVCYETLFQVKLPNVHLIALEDFEAGDEELLSAKKNRTLIEYYFTCTPSLPPRALRGENIPIGAAEYLCTVHCESIKNQPRTLVILPRGC